MSAPDPEFIRRQAGYLAAAGTPGEALAERLSEALGVEYLSAIERALAPEAAADRGALLERIRRTGEALGLSVPAAAAAAERLRHEVVETVRPAFRVFRGLAIYISTLGLLMVALLALFTQTVLPVFRDMFASFGADLPAPTVLVLRGDVQAGMVLGLLGLIGGLWVAGLLTRRCLLLRRTPSPVLLWLPVLGRPLRRFQPFLDLLIFDVLWRAGADPAALAERLSGVARDATHSRQGPGRQTPQLSRCLAAAARLGTVEREVAHWRNRLETDFMLSLVRTRDVAVLCVQVLLGLCIGYLVIAMYLPIFNMGSVI